MRDARESERGGCGQAEGEAEVRQQRGPGANEHQQHGQREGRLADNGGDRGAFRPEPGDKGTAEHEDCDQRDHIGEDQRRLPPDADQPGRPDASGERPEQREGLDAEHRACIVVRIPADDVDDRPCSNGEHEDQRHGDEHADLEQALQHVGEARLVLRPGVSKDRKSGADHHVETPTVISRTRYEVAKTPVSKPLASTDVSTTSARR